MAQNSNLDNISGNGNHAKNRARMKKVFFYALLLVPVFVFVVVTAKNKENLDLKMNKHH